MEQDCESGLLSEHDGQVAQACIENADELISSAELLIQSDRHHIAFHLAVLALEELGKRQIVTLNAMARRQEGADLVGTRNLEDHVGKLFWAFFFQYIFMENVNQSKIDEINGMASFLHEQRLEALYVDAERQPFVSPKNTVPHAQIVNVISTARGMLEIEKCFVPRTLSNEDQIKLAWLLKVSSDERLRLFIYGKSSMDKFRECGRFPGWIDWLQTQLTAEQTQFGEILRVERERAEAGLLEGRPRWEFEVHLKAISHKLKPSELSDWNSRTDFIKFKAGGKKPEQHLILTITLPDSIKIDGLYLAGKALAEKVMLALNIVTLGFYWWDRSALSERFTEYFKDLDSNHRIILNELPSTQIDWRATYLTREDLEHVGIAFAHLPWRFSGDAFAPLAWYADGLSFLATINVHRHHESYAFRCFYESYWLALEVLGRHKNERSHGTFRDSVQVGLRDPELVDQLYALGEKLSAEYKQHVAVTVEDVGKMKLLVDAYLVEWIKQANRNAPAPDSGTGQT